MRWSTEGSKGREGGQGEGRGGGEDSALGLGGSKLPQSEEVEAALAARLGPIRGDWLRDIGKRRTQAEAQGTECLYIKRAIRQFEEISHHGSIVARRGSGRSSSSSACLVGDRPWSRPRRWLSSCRSSIGPGSGSGSSSGAGSPLSVQLPLPLVQAGQVYGDVSSGASIRAGGDVVVLGRLSGKASAGMSGDRRASVFALAMEPSLLAIANEVVSGPEGAAQPYPEVALISEAGSISSMPYPEAGGGGGGGGGGPGGGRRRADAVMEHLASGHLLDVKWAVEPSDPRSAPPRLPSTKPAQVALFTGLYIGGAGLAAIVAPKTIFGLLFDVRVMTPGWIRVLGVLALLYGIYFLGTARGEMLGMGARGFYLATVVGRMVLFFAFCGFVACGTVQISLLVLALLNLVGALSMLWALRAED
eukprot:jgi/Mesen1/5605/ME000282S04759